MCEAREMTTTIALAPFLPIDGPRHLVFQRIIVATDFKQASSLALDAALSLAEPLGAEVVLVHVMSPPASAMFSGEGISPDEARASVRLTLDAALAAARIRYPRTTFCLAEGHAAEQILAVAASISADLIVMGTSGRSGLERVFLGSVAEQVLRQSPVPVLTVSSRPGIHGAPEGAGKSP